MEHQFAKRFTELKKLKNGWLDGYGVALDHDALDQLQSLLELYYPQDCISPRIYPVPEGSVILEWRVDRIDSSLEINLNLFVGYWHILDLDTGQYDEYYMSLEQREGWRGFINLVNELCKKGTWHKLKC